MIGTTLRPSRIEISDGLIAPPSSTRTPLMVTLEPGWPMKSSPKRLFFIVLKRKSQCELSTPASRMELYAGPVGLVGRMYSPTSQRMSSECCPCCSVTPTWSCLSGTMMLSSVS